LQSTIPARCIDGVVEGLRSKLPSYGTDLAVDASDMSAYANGQRYVYKGRRRAFTFRHTASMASGSSPDRIASAGRRSGAERLRPGLPGSAEATAPNLSRSPLNPIEQCGGSDAEGIRQLRQGVEPPSRDVQALEMEDCSSRPDRETAALQRPMPTRSRTAISSASPASI
jgi:hypothetical protein